jgi:hypothetical protein
MPRSGGGEGQSWRRRFTCSSSSQADGPVGEAAAEFFFRPRVLEPHAARQGDLGSGLSRTQLDVFRGQLLLQGAYLFLKFRGHLPPASRFARLGRGQQSREQLFAQLPEALLADLQTPTGLLDPAPACDGIEHRLDTFLGGVRSFLAIHDFRS